MAENMSSEDIIKRRWQATMMHRYGASYLLALEPQGDSFGHVAIVMGDRERKISISTETVDPRKHVGRSVIFRWCLRWIHYNFAPGVLKLKPRTK